MYGYIYMTTNKITGSLYVGKHKAPKYDPRYLGSGACISPTSINLAPFRLTGW